jgi:hypothetical protein
MKKKGRRPKPPRPASQSTEAFPKSRQWGGSRRPQRLQHEQPRSSHLQFGANNPSKFIDRHQSRVSRMRSGADEHLSAGVGHGTSGAPSAAVAVARRSCCAADFFERVKRQESVCYTIRSTRATARINPPTPSTTMRTNPSAVTSASDMHAEVMLSNSWQAVRPTFRAKSYMAHLRAGREYQS